MVSFIKNMPRVQVIVRVIGEGGDLASSEFTMTEEVTRLWSAGVIEDPFDLASSLGVTFRNSLRLDLPEQDAVRIVTRRNEELERIAEERRVSVLPHGLTYAHSEPEFVGVMPLSTELTEVDLSEFEARALHNLAPPWEDQPSPRRIRQTFREIVGDSAPEDRVRGQPQFSTMIDDAQDFQVRHPDQLLEQNPPPKRKRKEPVKRDRTAIPTRYKRSPVI